MTNPRARARSRTARLTTIESDDGMPYEDSRQADALKQDSPQAEMVSAGRPGKRKKSGLESDGVPSRKRNDMPSPSTVPPKRKAAMHAEKRNSETLAFFRQTQRQQSAALEQGRASAITTACTCAQITCKFCGPRAKLNQDSSEEKWK